MAKVNNKLKEFREDRVDKVSLNVILILGAVLLVPILVIYATIAYLNLIPNSDMTTINVAVLTASSILFGFATQSLARFSDKIGDLKHRMSDSGKELTELYNNVKKNKDLSVKPTFYSSKIEDFEGASFERDSYYGEALKVIENAYRSITYVLRWDLKNLYRIYIMTFQVAPVSALIGSIVASLLAFASYFTHTALIAAVSLLLLSMPTVLVGWYYSSKWLNSLDDSIFNIRQQIIGELAGILPEGYKTPEYKMWLIEQESKKKKLLT